MSRIAAPRNDLTELSGYHSPQVDAAVRLNTNESPFAPPPEFVDAWLDDLRSIPLHRYPDREATALREALGARLGCNPDRVFCANGSNEVLQTLLLTYGGAGRTVVVFEPTYALHSHIARITGTTVVVGERTEEFTVDSDAARGVIDRAEPALVVLCSPNNPTGTVETRETIEAIVEATDALVIVDEAYGEFADWSSLELVDDARRLVVVRTYSKVWSMAALRLGFAVAPAVVVADLEKVVLPYHLAAATQLAGVRALDYRDEMESRVAILVHERRRLVAELDRVDGVTAYESGANFVLLRVGSGAGDSDRAESLWSALLARSVLVRSFARWPRLEGCLRVTVGSPDENDRFLVALRDALTEVTG